MKKNDLDRDYLLLRRTDLDRVLCTTTNNITNN